MSCVDSNIEQNEKASVLTKLRSKGLASYSDSKLKGSIAYLWVLFEEQLILGKWAEVLIPKKLHKDLSVESSAE